MSITYGNIYTYIYYRDYVTTIVCKKVKFQGQRSYTPKYKSLFLNNKFVHNWYIIYTHDSQSNFVALQMSVQETFFTL